MMGFEGSAVQAHSTWFTEQRLVRRHGDRDGLDRSRRPARSTRPLIGAAPGLSYAAVAATGVPNSNFAAGHPDAVHDHRQLPRDGTVARFMPGRLATEMPQARSGDHLRVRVISTDAAS